jgi:aspartyl-tRNA(Asn)/glutamyl-tRNA(Gln) amidotransferase subunit B
VHETHITPAQIAGIVDLIAAGTISSKGGKDVLALLIGEEKDADPAELVQRRGLRQVTDTGAIEGIVDEIIAKNPDQVAKVLAKPTLIGWFVGQAMKASGGKANPQALNEILKRKLGI